MHTHTHMHAYAHLYTDRKSQQRRLNVSSNIIDAHTYPYTYACTYTYICTYTYVNTLQRVCSQMCVLMSKIHLRNVRTCTCTGAQNTCSKLHATLTAKQRTYIYTHAKKCTYMHTNTHAPQGHHSTRRSTDAETHNPYTNMHTHTYTHVYTCIRINIHIH